MNDLLDKFSVLKITNIFFHLKEAHISYVRNKPFLLIKMSINLSVPHFSQIVTKIAH
jgi:hypothetical protein